MENEIKTEQVPQEEVPNNLDVIQQEEDDAQFEITRQLEQRLFNFTEPHAALELADAIKKSILDGDIDPVKVGVILKRMAKVAKEIFENKKDVIAKDAIVDSTIRAMDGGSMASILGATIVQGATFTEYDFTVCNDPLWNLCAEIEETISVLKKTREEELKELMVPESRANSITFDVSSTVKEATFEKLPKLIFEDGDGEVFSILPPKKYAKMGIKYNNL